MNCRTLAGQLRRALFVACVLTVLCSLAPAVSSAAQVTLAWDANTDPDLAGYKLYYGLSSGSYQSSLDVGNVTSYTLSGLLEGQSYYFAATAYNLSLAESGFSNEVSKALADVTPPTVSLTAPANGATVSGTAVTVSASASDNVGVAGVQFSLDGVNLGAEDTVAPYSVSWNTTVATSGTHILTAVARDAAGNTATAVGISVTVANDTTPPVISSVSASNISSAAATITWATNEAGDSQVDYGLTTAYGSSTPLNLSLLTAHAVTLTGLLATTPYHYRVKSRDAAGNLATSADFTLTTLIAGADSTPPTVSITAPTSGSTVSGTVTISVSATDNVGVVGVQFQLDGVNVGAEVTVAPYTLSWDTTSVSNGTHTLTAVARDAAGNTAAAPAVSVTVVNGSLVGFWALDDGSGTTAADSSGNGNTGTLVNGPTWVVGKVGGALSLDGVSQYVNIAHTPTLNAYPLTVALWMKTSATTGLQGVVNKYVSRSGNGYQVLLNGGNLCAWYFKDAANYVWDGTGCTLTTPGYADNLWHHVAFVVDAAGGWLYVDGVLQATQPWTGAAGATSTTQALSLGLYPSDIYFPGSLDDVRIYNRALSATEVATLYGAAPPASDTTPPTVSMTAPAAGATVAGTITVSASATDTVGVVGVQFKLDGANLGAEVTAPPYVLSWNTGTASNGAHTLTAVARDAAGNTATAAAVSVTVGSTSPLISSVSASNVSSSGATITWTTNEASTTQVEYGLTPAYGNATVLNTNLVTSHSQALSGLARNTWYHYRVKSQDAAGNLAVSGDFVFKTTRK